MTDYIEKLLGEAGFGEPGDSLLRAALIRVREGSRSTPPASAALAELLTYGRPELAPSQVPLRHSPSRAAERRPFWLRSRLALVGAGLAGAALLGVLTPSRPSASLLPPAWTAATSAITPRPSSPSSLHAPAPRPGQQHRTKLRPVRLGAQPDLKGPTTDQGHAQKRRSVPSPSARTSDPSAPPERRIHPAKPAPRRSEHRGQKIRRHLRQTMHEHPRHREHSHESAGHGRRKHGG
jgi:hypothetical protein